MKREQSHIPNIEETSTTSSYKRMRRSNPLGYDIESQSSHEHDPFLDNRHNYHYKSKRGYKDSRKMTFPHRNNNHHYDRNYHCNSMLRQYATKDTKMFATTNIANSCRIRQYSTHRHIRLKHYLGGNHSHLGAKKPMFLQIIRSWQSFCDPIDNWIMKQPTDYAKSMDIICFLQTLSFTFNEADYPFDWTMLIDGIHNINYCRFHVVEDVKLEVRVRNDVWNRYSFPAEEDHIASPISESKLNTIDQNGYYFQINYPDTYKNSG